MTGRLEALWTEARDPELEYGWSNWAETELEPEDEDEYGDESDADTGAVGACPFEPWTT